MLAALETMTYSGRPVESIPEFRMTAEMLRNFEVLVLPETEVVSSMLAETIRAWVHDGGTLIASGRCGLLDEQRHARDNFALANVLGVNYAGEERKYAYDPDGKFKEKVIQTYLESSGHSLAQMLAESTVGLSGAFLKLRRERVLRRLCTTACRSWWKTSRITSGSTGVLPSRPQHRRSGCRL